MEIKATLVKELRDKTGAGMMDCKRALVETGGDLEKAIDYLKTKGLAKAEKRMGRTATEGRIASYIHRPGEKIGVLVEVNCETDFVARTEEFAAFVRDVAMHVAASNPQWVSRTDLPEAARAREEAIYREQAKESGKPEKIWPKMIEGKMEKFYGEVCLLEQRFVKNPDQTIDQLTKELITKTGENIVIRRFARFQVGEAL
ncbi:MAG: elongation factor Ts [Deltaproteobacteria bacterium RBG_13_61_14]|nr:MAG: elongation factor Ts [Deltaproteobacteria bacterium RBG_13_61_14]